MELKKGYKQTELGVIPEDWVLFPISKLFEFQGGSQPPRGTFIFNESKGYIRLLQIRDYKTDKYASFIPISLAKRTCTDEDIMIGRYGPPIFQILKGLKGAYNVALIKAIPTEIITKKYAWFILNQNKLFEFVDKLSQRSSGQTGVDLHELKKYEIPLPPTLAEQTAIATALSDMDDLISSLSTLIQKKKAIKQGVMQELLTGKRRLPGFRDNWKINKLENLTISISSGKSKIGSKEGDYPIYGSTSILGWQSHYDYEGSKILIARVGANAGVVNTVKGKYCVSDNTLIVDLNSTVSVRFVHYILTNKKLNNLVFGSGQPLITGGQLKNLEIFAPVDLSEQEAISSLILDLDGEITTLTQNLSKYQLLKQGMMQELLTGKTRLV